MGMVVLAAVFPAVLPAASGKERDVAVLRGMAKLSVKDRQRSLALITTIYQQIVDI
jgi:hypothetical protein